MKKTLHRIMIALALVALVGTSALAGNKSKNVRFDDDITVNGTLLKKGTYKVVFNEETGELTISRGKLVVKTTAKLEESKKTAAGYAPEYKTRTESGAMLLTSVNMGGAYAVIADGAGGGAPAAQ